MTYPKGYFLADYYDEFLGLCCSYPGCLSSDPTLLGSHVQSAVGDPQSPVARARWIAFAVFVLVFAMGAVWHWYSTRLPIYLDNGKKKDLRRLSVRLSLINFPRFTSGILLWSAIGIAYQIVDILFRNFAAGKLQAGDSSSDFVALAIAATAVLFPLVLLIMSSSASSAAELFSSPEVLLRHAYAFPVSIVLLSVLANLAFPSHFYTVQCAVVFSLAIAAWVFFRLMQVMFTPSERDKTEKGLLRTIVDDSVREVARLRSGLNSSLKKIENLKPFVRAFWTIKANEDWKKVEIQARAVGIVSDIFEYQLEKAVAILRKKATGDDSLASAGTAPSQDEESLTKNLQFEIVLRVTAGDFIEGADRNVAQIHYSPSLQLTAKDLADVTDLVRSAIKVERTAGNLSVASLEALLTRLKQVGRAAIASENIVSVERLSDTYGIIHAALLEAFKALEISYDMKSAKHETGLFGKDWKPLTLLQENAVDLQERAFGKELGDHEIRRTILFLPYRLATKALRGRDLLTFTKFVQLAIYQDRLLSTNTAGFKERYSPLEWLEPLFEHHLTKDLEESVAPEKPCPSTRVMTT